MPSVLELELRENNESFSIVAYDKQSHIITEASCDKTTKIIQKLFTGDKIKHELFHPYPTGAPRIVGLDTYCNSKI